MKQVIQNIEDVVVTVSISSGRQEVCYNVPQGMSGYELLAFKIRNKSLIEYLKTLTDEKKLKHRETDDLLLQPRSQEGLSDNLNLQEIKLPGASLGNS